MEKIIINNNIRLHYMKMSKLKTTSVSIFIHRPLSESDVSYNALLPLVLKSGCELCSDRESISKYLENLYGATMGASTIKCGEDHVIYFDAETISDKYAPNNELLVSDLLELLMSVVFHPKTINNSFDNSIVEQEKINACDRVDSYKNDKRRYAASRCQEETARGTKFSINTLGDKEKIKSISAESLYEYYTNAITSSIIDVYICGETDIEIVKNTITKSVLNLNFNNAQIPTTDIIIRNEDKINFVTDEMDVTQGKLSIGFLTNIKPTDDDYYSLMVFNSLFGAGAHSKLFNNVREKLSLAYYASTMLERYKGIITVNAGIEFKNYQKAYDETLVQLDEIRNNNISEHEFNASISAILNSLNSYFDDQRALETFSLMNEVAGVNKTLEEIIEQVKNVTIKQVVEVSKKIKIDTVYFLKGKETE